MSYPTTKKKIKEVANSIDLSFYQPKKILRKYGYAQNRLAEEMGVSDASIAGIVNGNPSIAQVMMMAEHIGCSFFEFFDFSKVGGSQQLNSQQVKCPACGVTLGISVQ